MACGEAPQFKEASIHSATYWSSDRAGIAWMMVSVVVAVTIFAAVVVYYPFLPQRNASAGFGSDWDCTPHPRGEPTCIKKIGR